MLTETYSFHRNLRKSHAYNVQSAGHYEINPNMVSQDMSRLKGAIGLIVSYAAYYMATCKINKF